MAVDMVKVNSGLDSFVFPDAILKIDDSHIKASVQLKNLSGFMGVEVLAQTAAMHVRYLRNFAVHAFLLKVEQFDEHRAIIPGVNHDIEGRLAGKTDSAFSYQLSMKCHGETVNRGKLIIAVKNYDDVFKKEVLKGYYRDRFRRLMEG